MHALGNDRHAGAFAVEGLGRHVFAVRGWIDRFATWRDQLGRRVEAGQDVRSELETGAAIIQAAAESAPPAAAGELAGWRKRLLADDTGEGAAAALDPALAQLMAAHDPRPHCVDSDLQVTVQVDPPLARFGAWYELFPRSLGGRPPRDAARCEPGARPGGGHGLRRPLPAADPPDRRDAPQGPEQRSGRAAGRPRQPLGDRQPRTAGTPPSTASSARSPTCAGWPLRAPSAGSRSRSTSPSSARPTIPGCASTRSGSGTARTGRSATPRTRPSATRTSTRSTSRATDWRGLWHELLEVVRFWIGQGVRVFRVDNPHTKPFPFWEWLIGEVKRDHPDVHLPGRGVHTAAGDGAAGEGGLHASRTPTSRGATASTTSRSTCAS